MTKSEKLLNKHLELNNTHISFKGTNVEKPVLDAINEAFSLTDVGYCKNGKIAEMVESALYKSDEDFGIIRFPDGSIKSIDEDKIMKFVEYINK